jgi:hypothetical protein
MSAAARRNVASAPSSSSTGFTSEEDLFFETGKAMEAVMQEDAAAEAWEDEILGPRNRKGLLKPALRLGLVVAAAVGLFVIGGLLMTGTTSANDAARTIAAKFR